MAIYLFSQILKFKLYSIKLIKKLSRRHLINSSDVFVIKGFTVYNWYPFPAPFPISIFSFYSQLSIKVFWAVFCWAQKELRGVRAINILGQFLQKLQNYHISYTQNFVVKNHLIFKKPSLISKNKKAYLADIHLC